MLSVNTGSRVVPRWSEKMNVTPLQSMGDTSSGRQGPASRWSISALLRSTVPSPGARAMV